MKPFDLSLLHCCSNKTGLVLLQLSTVKKQDYAEQE